MSRSRPPPHRTSPVAGERVRKRSKPSISDGSHLATGYRDDPDARMRHILHSMVVDGHARQVVQQYLKAMRAGENADQIAVTLIAKLRPGLTLAEPADMLERLLAWVAAEHGAWWRKALLRPPPLHSLSLRELYRRGWIIEGSCSRHRSNEAIYYSVVRAERLLNCIDPPVRDALAKLRCPKCHMRVDDAKVTRRPEFAESFLARASRHRR